MRIYFSTVVRCSPVEQGGELVCLDWESKQVVATTPIRPTNPEIQDPNPRGNSRGGRGIHLCADEVIVASYHTLKVFDRDLRYRRDISNGLMVGLHEVHGGGDSSLWVASTSIDAAFLVDVGTGEVRRGIWPRESGAFQKALNLEPLQIDKQADNRTRFLTSPRRESLSHLHFNAVASWKGEMFGLFHSPGVIANLDTETIVVHSPTLVGAHNLLIDEQGVATVNDTQRRKVRKFELSTGKELDVIDLTAFPWVRHLVGRSDTGAAFRLRSRLRQVLRRAAHKMGLRARRSGSRPLFVRGLDRVGDLLFVGVSPAAIVCLDERRGEFVDGYRHSTDVNTCVHGLKALA